MEPPLENFCSRLGKNLGFGQNVEYLNNTNVFLKNRKKKPPGEFQEESIAVVYFKIVRLEIAR